MLHGHMSTDILSTLAICFDYMAWCPFATMFCFNLCLNVVVHWLFYFIIPVSYGHVHASAPRGSFSDGHANCQCTSCSCEYAERHSVGHCCTYRPPDLCMQQWCLGKSSAQRTLCGVFGTASLMQWNRFVARIMASQMRLLSRLSLPIKLR